MLITLMAERDVAWTVSKAASGTTGLACTLTIA
jgi:hypothetical protein